MGRWDDLHYGEGYGLGISNYNEEQLLYVIVKELCNLSDQIDYVLGEEDGRIVTLRIIGNKIDQMNKELRKITENTDLITQIPGDEAHYNGIHSVITRMDRLEKELDEIRKLLGEK